MTHQTTLWAPLPVDIQKSCKQAHDLLMATLDIYTRATGIGPAGGWQHVHGRDGACLLLAHAGTSPKEKGARRRELALEKAARVRTSPGTRLSFETMDPDRERYQGAARMENGWVHSFSGLPSETDEALVMAIGVGVGWSSDAWAEETMRISGNVMQYRDLWRAVEHAQRKFMRT